MSFTSSIKCKSPVKRRYLLTSTVWIATFLLISGCAYFNTIFNATKSFNDGLKKIKENNNTKNIPVLMLTGENAITDVAECLSMGANDYMVKPFETETLLIRLKLILPMPKIEK